MCLRAASALRRPIAAVSARLCGQDAVAALAREIAALITSQSGRGEEMLHPPSIQIEVPVMNPLCSVARKIQAFATSSG